MTAMLVHPGPGLHGHEFSKPKDSSSTQNDSHRPLPLLRSALRPLSTDGHAAAMRSFSDGTHSLSTATRTRPLSEVLPSRKDLGVRFRGTGESDDGEEEGSIFSTGSSTYAETTAPSSQQQQQQQQQQRQSSKRRTRRRPRSMPRPGTRYALAHPAPLRRTKQRMLVQFRPRLLLQLQRLSPHHRPTPELDAVPSGIIAGSILIPKLAKRFPRIFLAKPHVGPDDVLLMRSEKYDDDRSSNNNRNCDDLAHPSTPHDGLASRELVAIISPLSVKEGGADLAEIVTGDGSVWSTSRMPNGSYEFNRVDVHGVRTTARWVLRKCKSDPDTSDNAKKWTFSVLDPCTRRHPVMGTLSPQELIVYDSYRTAPSYVADREEEEAGDDDEGDDDDDNDDDDDDDDDEEEDVDASGQLRKKRRKRKKTMVMDLPTTVAVAEEYKLLMAATASWINLRLEGWPATASPKMKRVASDAGSTRSADRRQSFPLPVSRVSTSLPGSNTVPAVSRGHGDSASASTSTSVTTSTLLTVTAAEKMPQRSKSTGSVFTGRRRKQAETRSVLIDERIFPDSDDAGAGASAAGEISRKQPQQHQQPQQHRQHQQHKSQAEGYGADDDVEREEEKQDGKCRDKMRRLTQRLFHRKK